MSLLNPTLREFIGRVKQDHPDWNELSNEQIKQTLRENLNARGLGAEVKQNASQAALDFIAQHEAAGGDARSAMRALDHGANGPQGNTHLLVGGRLNPALASSLARPQAATPQAVAPAAGAALASGNAGPEHPSPPLAEPQAGPPAQQAHAAGSGQFAGLADAVKDMSPGQQLLMGMLVLPMVMNASGNAQENLMNFLAHAPEGLQKAMPASLTEMLVKLIGAGDHASTGTGHGLLAALRGEAPDPVPAPAAPVAQMQPQPSGMS